MTGGIEIRLHPLASGLRAGSIWVRSNGGQVTIDVRVRVASERRGSRRPGTLVTLGVASVAAISLGVAGLTLGSLRHSPPAQPSRPVPTTPLAQTSDPGGVGVPHVYGFSEAVGTSRLEAAGFRARSIFVCSSSVSRGNVRQVLIDDRDGVIVDDQGGVTAAGSALATGTALVMKISTGVPCNLPVVTSAPTPTPTPVITPTGTPSRPVPTRPPGPTPTL